MLLVLYTGGPGGHYDNEAICTLESLLVASFSNGLAWQELLKCHQHDLPSFCSKIPISLMMEIQSVVNTLRSFSCGSSTSSSGF